MRFILDNLPLIGIALISGGMLLWTSLSRGTGGVSPAEAVRLINHEKGVLIDVCEPAEHAAGHCPGARNIPLGQIDKRLGELPKNKDLPVLVACQSGMRAERAAAALRRQGWTRATAIAGGLRAWREAGLPVDKG